MHISVWNDNRFKDISIFCSAFVISLTMFGLTNSSAHVCDSTGATSLFSSGNIELFEHATTQYVIGGMDLARSEVTLFPISNSPSVPSDIPASSITPSSISLETDQVYTIKGDSSYDSLDVRGWDTSDITISWSALDPECVGNCSGSCSFTVTVWDRPMGGGMGIILKNSNNFSDDAIDDLGMVLDIFLSMLDEPVAEPEATQIEESVDTINESIDLIESVIDELQPITVIANDRDELRFNLEVGNDLLQDNMVNDEHTGENSTMSSLALKNSTSVNSHLIELFELDITNFKQAIASLGKIEVGMLAGDAIPLLEDAIVSLEKGKDLILSVIDALDADCATYDTVTQRVHVPLLDAGTLGKFEVILDPPHNILNAAPGSGGCEDGSYDPSTEEVHIPTIDAGVLGKFDVRLAPPYNIVSLIPK